MDILLHIVQRKGVKCEERALRALLIWCKQNGLRANTETAFFETWEEAGQGLWIQTDTRRDKIARGSIPAANTLAAAVSPLSPPPSMTVPSVKSPILPVLPKGCTLALDANDNIPMSQEAVPAWPGACVGGWGGTASCCGFPWWAPASGRVTQGWLRAASEHCCRRESWCCCTLGRAVGLCQHHQEVPGCALHPAGCCGRGHMEAAVVNLIHNLSLF